MCSQFLSQTGIFSHRRKELAEDIAEQVLAPGIEGSPLDSGEIWAVVTLAAVNQTSVWETCKDNDNAPPVTILSWTGSILQPRVARADC